MARSERPRWRRARRGHPACRRDPTRCPWCGADADHLAYHDTEWGVPLRDDRAVMPARTPESDAMSKDLKRRGFEFVGSTICYAFMQAAGVVDDHLVDCFRHQAVARMR